MCSLVGVLRTERREQEGGDETAADGWSAVDEERGECAVRGVTRGVADETGLEWDDMWRNAQ